MNPLSEQVTKSMSPWNSGGDMHQSAVMSLPTCWLFLAAVMDPSGRTSPARMARETARVPLSGAAISSPKTAWTELVSSACLPICAGGL